MRTFVVLVSAILSVSPVARADDSLTPVDVVLGEWRPFVSESIDGYGEIAERVTAVLERMGYRPNYIFMPWGQAEKAVRENETNIGPRVTFPYLSTTKRRGEFLFSGQPVLETCMRFFYNRNKFEFTPTPISSIRGLPKSGLGYVKTEAGFQYPEKPEDLGKLLEGLRAAGNAVAVDSLYEAFRRLVDEADRTVRVVPAAMKAGEEMLAELFPEKHHEIRPIEEEGTDGKGCLLHVEYYLLLSKRNPDNVEFARRFDDAYSKLDRWKEGARANARADSRPSLRYPRVVLRTAGDGAAIPGREAGGQVYALPRGTRGLLIEWRPGTGSTLLDATATVRVTNGPYRGKVLVIDGRHVTLE